MQNYSQVYIATRTQLIFALHDKRLEYRRILSEHIKKIYNTELLNAKDLELLPKSAFLLSSSRSGSSVSADILSQHAKGCKHTESKLLCLPGELRPYFVLAMLTPPFVDGFSDALGSQDTKDLTRIDILLRELSQEIGYPVGETSDILTYAITFYGRLLLQWPTIDFGSADTAIAKIHKIIEDISSSVKGIPTYIDSPVSRQRLLLAINKHFPGIDLRFYDIMHTKRDAIDESYSINFDCLVEEPPFIVPVPWNFATRDEIGRGVLLIKDPSNAWRIPFWREILKSHTISWLHLTRNVLETINGLCDGWKYPFGYISNRSPSPLKIRGYSNKRLPWTQWYSKFSTSNRVWELLLSEESVDLEYVCATQWADAHRSIINLVSNDQGYCKISSKKEPSKIGFEWLRSEPVEAISRICEDLDVQLSQSLIDAANSIKKRLIQVTPGTYGRPDRWKVARNRDLIIKYSQEQYISEISERIGCQHPKELINA